MPFAIDPTPTAVADNTADSIDLTGMQILLAEDNDLNMEIAEFKIAADHECAGKDEFCPCRLGVIHAVIDRGDRDLAVCLRGDGDALLGHT